MEVSRLSPFWLAIFMGLVAVVFYAATVPLHELGHIFIGAAYGQHLGTVEWFNATAWARGEVLGESGALGYVVMLPTDPNPQLAFVQLTLYHATWNAAMLIGIVLIESRILKAWKDGR